MKQTTLELLMKTENIMGVYRNYSSQMNFRKIRITRVVLELLISGIILLKTTYEAVLMPVYFDHSLMHRMLTYHFLNFFSTCTITIPAISSSDSYTIFSKNLIAVHQSFNKEWSKQYSRKLKNIFIVITAMLCFCGLGTLPLRILYRILVQKRHLNPSLIMLLTIELFTELRFSLEHVIFYIYIRMIHFSLKRLNDYVSDLQNYYIDQERKICVERKEINDPLTADRMEEWASNYMLLVGCSKKLSACFNFQVNV